jgi:hypothetical protein
MQADGKLAIHAKKDLGKALATYLAKFKFFSTRLAHVIVVHELALACISSSQYIGIAIMFITS